MLELARLLALLAFVALALAIFVFLRRAGQLIADTREREAFRRLVVDLVGRAGTSLDAIAVRVDAVRRRTVAPAAITENLAAAADAVIQYGNEARTLPKGARTAEVREAIITDLDRAARAIQMIEHGCAILTSARPGARELEAQTSIKRGYLNILHARDALARHGTRAVELAAVDRPRLFQRPNT